MAQPTTIEALVVMGPRLRGDDSSWFRAKDSTVKESNAH
jgi:hypothetical protein